MLVELPDHFDYDVDRIEFTVNGNPHYAVVASMRSSVAIKGRIEYYKAMVELSAGGVKPEEKEVLDEFGLPVIELGVPEVGQKPMARWCRRLVVETDCNEISEALMASEDLRNTVLEAAMALEAKFNAKKKS